MIQYFSEEVDLPQIDQAKYSDWLIAVAKNHDYEIEQINYVFCSDDYLLKINQEHLQHDYYTDIITFPLKENPIAADIFISIDRVKENADGLELSFEQELQRVMVHGLLHMLGYNDKDDEGQSKMRTQETKSIAQLKLI